MRILDHAVEGLMQALDAKGMANNMVVVFTSDNGAPSTYSSDPNGGSNFPYRGFKGTSYEVLHKIRARKQLWFVLFVGEED